MLNQNLMRQMQNKLVKIQEELANQTVEGTIQPVARLIEAFARLPGIGPKTAQRLTFFLLRAPAEVSEELAEALAQMKGTVIFCSTCFNITSADPCNICQDPRRDHALIC